MVTTTLCTISRKKETCLVLSYEKQGFYKGLDCGERNCSTSWRGLMALVRKTHLQDKPWLTMCRKDLRAPGEPLGFHEMGNRRAFWRGCWRPLARRDPRDPTTSCGSKQESARTRGLWQSSSPARPGKGNWAAYMVASRQVR